jgi:RNA polymerase sigma-70 factor, ECF subfamily
MHPTPVSLLQRLAQPADAAAWNEFVDLYTPLFLSWARRLGLQDADAADLVQSVFLALLRALPFDYRPGSSFRAWLRTVALNEWRKRGRRPTPRSLDEVAEPVAEDHLDEFEELDYRRHVVGRALARLQGELTPATWRAWQAYAVEGRPAAEVAAELGTSVNAVYVARATVLRRLRRELEGLLD